MLTLTETGTHVVQVQAQDSIATGTDGVSVEGISPASVDAVALALGDAVEDSINIGGDVDAYTFVGATGDVVTVSLGQVTLFGGGWTRVQARVFAPSGTELATVLDGTQPEFTLTETGTHVVQVHDLGYGQSGGYGIGVEGVSPPSLDAVALALGDAVEADLTAGEVDAYTFSGTAGDVVSVAVGEVSGFATSEDVQAQAFSPSGSPLGTVLTGTQVEFTLTETGTHVVQVYGLRGTGSSRATSTGTYGVSVL